MNPAKKTLLISGATGLVGRALCDKLEEKGHVVKRLSRAKNAEVRWDLAAGIIDADAMKDVDVVVHLRDDIKASERGLPTRLGIEGGDAHEAVHAVFVF